MIAGSFVRITVAGRVIVGTVVAIVAAYAVIASPDLPHPVERPLSQVVRVEARHAA